MSIHWRRHGQGEHLIIALHGWMGSQRSFNPLIPYIPAGVSLIACDLPGYGNSSKLDDYSAENVTTALEELIKELQSAIPNHRSVALLGSCSGTIFSLYLASRGLPIDRLVLLDPFPSLPWYLRLLTLGPLGRACYNLAFNLSWGQKIAAHLLPQKKEVSGQIESIFQCSDHAVTQSYLKAFAARQPVQDLLQFATIDLPIDFIFGEHSFQSIRNGIPLWQELFPEAQFHDIPDAGHFLLEEATIEISGILYEPILGSSVRYRIANSDSQLTDSRRKLTLRGKGESSCTSSSPVSVSSS